MEIKKEEGIGLQEINKKIYDIKMNIPVDELCQDLPTAIRDFLLYSRNLQFDTKPNYIRWIHLFKRQESRYIKGKFGQRKRKVMEIK